MPRFFVSLFGGFSVTRDGKPVTGFESNKVRALLAYLTTEADRAHSRDKLAALLWPDMPDPSARNNLRYALSNLRKVTGEAHTSQPILCISKQTVKISLNGDLEADVLTFNRQLAQSPLALSNLEEAMRVYQGDFLEGFYVGGDSTFEEWVVLKREQFRRQALDALHRLAQAYEKNGDVDHALSASWHLVDLEPWSEEAHRYLMLLLALSGRRAAALSQYETCRRVLAEELNVEPSRETARLYEQIRDGEIRPLQPTPESASRLVETQTGTQDEPARRDRLVFRWLKIIGAGLLVAILAGMLMYYFISRGEVAAPVNVSANGEVIGRCFEQVQPRLCIINAQTGLMTPIAKDLPIDELGPGFSWSPDGQKIAFSACLRVESHLLPGHLYVIDRDGSNLQQITSGNSNDILPAWSPDGEWIAYHGNCTLWIVHPDGTEARPLSSGLCATGIAWSPDSRWIAFLESGSPDGNRPATIRIFEHMGNDSRIVYTFSQPVKHGQAMWSPDGRQIFVIYNLGGRDNKILLDAQGQGVLEQGLEIPIAWMHDFHPQWGK